MNTNIRKQKQPKHPHHPSNCKAGASKKQSPLGEGGADRRRKGGTRSHKKTAPQPRHKTKLTTQTKPHYTCKAIQYRKRAPPLRALTGPPLPKGRGLLYEPRKQNRTKPSPKQPIDPEVVVIVVVACSIRGVGWRREFPLNHL